MGGNAKTGDHHVHVVRQRRVPHAVYLAAQARKLPVQEVHAAQVVDDGIAIAPHADGTNDENELGVVRVQVLRACQTGLVRTVEGEDLFLEFDSICLHSDTPGALDLVHLQQPVFAGTPFKLAEHAPRGVIKDAIEVSLGVCPVITIVHAADQPQVIRKAQGVLQFQVVAGFPGALVDVAADRLVTAPVVPLIDHLSGQGLFH
ncbi:LamB/YcsF family protein [Serratia proteamaculans]|uniref:LamB/YcsF family protein n=1 Tax=Serratia proteamaculans TaxID=28151 RepID=UPI003D094461